MRSTNEPVITKAGSDGAFWGGGCSLCVPPVPSPFQAIPVPPTLPGGGEKLPDVPSSLGGLPGLELTSLLLPHTSHASPQAVSLPSSHKPKESLKCRVLFLLCCTRDICVPTARGTFQSKRDQTGSNLLFQSLAGISPSLFPQISSFPVGKYHSKSLFAVEGEKKIMDGREFIPIFGGATGSDPSQPILLQGFWSLMPGWDC